MKRRIAVHEVRMDDGKVMRMAVLELTDGIVTDCHRLTDEEPQTAWLGGTVTLRKNSEGQLQAFKNDRLLC